MLDGMASIGMKAIETKTYSYTELLIKKLKRYSITIQRCYAKATDYWAMVEQTMGGICL